MNPRSAPVLVALVRGNTAVATESEQYTGASYLTFGPPNHDRNRPAKLYSA